jgi:transposase-like protein
MSQLMLTPEQRIRQRYTWFEEAERFGNVTVACKRLGISRKTFYKWRKRFQVERRRRTALRDRSRRPLSLLKTYVMRFGETSRHRRSCSQPLVVVMQTAYFWNLDYRTLVGWQHEPRFGAIHGQRQMRAPTVVILEVAGDHTPQVAHAQDTNGSAL